MPRITWHAVGSHLFETGVDRGVLYVDANGYPWNGLTTVDASPSGGEAKPYYMDGVKYLNLSQREEFRATVTALYSPPQFDACDGLGELRPGLFAGQQKRKEFGLCYRTIVGNDVSGVNHGYKLHIIYNALAAPTQRNAQTASDDPEVALLSWAITTKPRLVAGMMNTSYLVVDTTRAAPAAVAELESILYGTDISAARLPTPAEIVDIFTDSTEFTVTDLGGGLFEISGSDLAVFEVTPGTFQITSDTVVPIDADRAQISSP